MYPTGHYGVALLVALPAALLLGRREATVFTTLALVAAVLPDLDKHVPGVAHHGVTHTLLFAVASAVVVGALVAGAVEAWTRARGSLRWQITTRRAFTWTAAGAFVGVSAHVLADVLVVLPGTQPVSPFWPVIHEKYRVEVLRLGAPVRNGVLLLAGLLAHGVAHEFVVE